MLVNELAHSLAEEIKESEEYRRLLQVLEKVNQTENTRNMLAEFQQKRMELQQSQLRGEAVPEEKARQIEKMKEALAANPTMTEYQMAELSLLQMIEKVEKIIWKGVEGALLIKPQDIA